MIACDIHGKNHHKEGSFGSHVMWLDLVLSDGSIVRCSPQENRELLASTIGGMGLTGVILRCCVRMRRIETAYIRQRCVIAKDLAAVLEAFETSSDWTYSVAWIDCLARGDNLGRSVLYLGEHAKVEELPADKRATPLHPKRKLRLSVPTELPISAFNALTIKLFNELYFRRAQLRSPDAILDYDSYFYPLDSILNWNRLYGYKGFVQHQSVLPLSTSRQGLTEILQLTSDFNAGSFLAVLKLFGTQEGVLSFPAHGYTLALDFPWSRKTATLLDRIDEVVLRQGGHVYLAKDARVSRAAFERMQPNLETFRLERKRTGAGRVFRSVQSERLGL